MKTSIEVLTECSVDVAELKSKLPMLFKNIVLAMEQYAGEHIRDLRSQLLEGNKKPQYPQLIYHADFETWCVFNEKELDCIFAESGADREMCFDREAEELKIWENSPRINH